MDLEESQPVTIRVGELLRIVKDQIEERGVVVIVSNRESAIWREAGLRSVTRENQLKYVDVEETRVITNNRCVAEQIKLVKVKDVVMGGVKTGKVGTESKRGEIVQVDHKRPFETIGVEVSA